MIEEGVLDGFDPNLLRTSRYAEYIFGAARLGRRVIALGVDSLALLKVLQEMQVACAAGDLIGKSVAVPTRTLSAAAHKAIAEKVLGQTGQPPSGVHVLEKMLQSVPPVTPETSADEVFARFETMPDLRAIAVVKNDTAALSA
jgi:EAL domain-containing protein (putative c-di-GMP-specific phosphodiesterase class I)